MQKNLVRESKKIPQPENISQSKHRTWLASALGLKLCDTWKCRIIVQINPNVSFGLPSVMSSGRMFTVLIWKFSFYHFTLKLARGKLSGNFWGEERGGQHYFTSFWINHIPAQVLAYWNGKTKKCLLAMAVLPWDSNPWPCGHGVCALALRQFIICILLECTLFQIFSPMQ